MSILIFAFLVILVVALIVWAIDRAPFGDARLKWLLEAIVVVLAAILIAQRAGLV